MTNRPNRSRYARWIDKLEGLSDDPLRRAAQIALAAIDEVMDGPLPPGDDTAMVAAYEALQSALANNN